MAIEIVGKDEGAKKKTTCKNCASVLVYTDADTKREVHIDYIGDSSAHRILVCPECKERINLGLA
jgi:RNase P subunit RPR2